MSDPLIVFFDTFTHNGQTQENTDCVRFKSGIQLLEVRILPFGSVVDSNLSDEALLGATNPASFDVTLYSNSQTNCITLHNIAKHHFDERNGINSIVLKEPVQSNLVLFRGKYSTLTVALFGLPTLPLNPSLHHAANLTVPPPQLTLTTSPASHPTNDAINSTYQPQKSAAGAETRSFAAVQKEIELPRLSSGLSWSQENSTETRADSGLQKSASDHGTEVTEMSGVNQEDNSENLKEVPSEVGGLYEDGEIQDIDYEEISSNEELFSEIDEADLTEEGLQTIDLTNSSDPRFARSQWRFNPWKMIDALASHDRLRIPDPCLTLFEMHCWLLERLDRNEARNSPAGPPAPSDTRLSIDANEDQSQLLPPPEDWSQSASSAQMLLSAAEKFPPGAAGFFDQMWVETMENIGTHLASGLAFLHCTDKTAYHLVNEALIIWVYTGLDMSAALRQSNSTYIVRHLMAGVNLVGLVTGTTSRPLAWSLLYPTGSETQSNSPELVVLQVQHRLLNLLESPLITTPLRLAICRSLDQTTRLSIGLDAFLGRSCPAPRSPSHREPTDNADDSKPPLVSEPEESKPDCSSAMPDEHKLADMAGKHDNGDGDDQDSNDATVTNGKDHSSIDLGQTVDLKRTPYQRLVFLLSSTKNSRVTSAFQRLLNKVHAYEMLLEFHDFVKELRSGNQCRNPTEVSASLRLENQLTYYLTQLANLWKNADELIANPRSTLPCPMLLDASKKHYHNPYPDLCMMFDSTHILDSVIWILEMLLAMDTCSDKSAQTFAHTVKSELEPLDGSSEKFERSFILSDTIASALMDFFSTLMSHSSGLALLASRPKSTGRLLEICLSWTIHHTAAPRHGNTNDGDEASLMENDMIGFVILGLELAYKLEAFRCIDMLVAWARKKGVHSTVAELRAELDDSLVDNEKSGDPLEPMLRDALFDLARLPASASSATPNAAIPSDWWEWISPVLTSSAPSWVAEVVSMDDHFVPLLMLLEALSDQESLAASATNKPSMGTVQSSESLKDANDTEKSGEAANSSSSTTELTTTVTSEVQASGGIRATLKQMLANPLDVSSLVTTIVLNLLRHGENVTYLDRYGPRLAMLVSPHNWEDIFEDPVALGMFTRLRTFNRSAAALFLAWLRDCPARPPTATNTPNLLCLPPPTPLSTDAFAWLTTQLKPLISELEEALDALTGVEIAEDLVLGSSVNPTAGGRKAPYNQTVSVGRYLPSGLLVLLRLIRVHVCGVSAPRSRLARSVIPMPEQQIVLGQTLTLIELYSANGLHLLLSLVQKIADHFLLQLQATVCQSTSSSDLLGVSVFNVNTCMLLSLLDNAVHIITQLLVTILHVRGDQFADLTPVHTLCLAYACALYTPSPPGVKADQLAQIRDAAVTGIMAYMGTEVQTSIKVEHLEKSMWVGVCKEVIAFTISAPIHYLAGVRLLLDLLPLPLPVFTLHRLSEDDQQRIRATRDAWAVRICTCVTQIAGLVELLGATEPRSRNPLYTHVLALVRRVADLGVPCATALATTCLDSLFSVWDELVTETAKKRKKVLSNGTDQSDTDPVDKCTSDARPVGDAQAGALSLRAPSSRLLLLTCSSGNAESNPLDAALLTDGGRLSMDSETPSSRSILPTPVNAAAGVLVEPFLELEDSTELLCALNLLYINLQVPACRYALLQLLRQGSLDGEDTGTSRLGKSHDDAGTTADVARNRSYGRQFCRLVNHILSPCSDKSCHNRTQLMLLKCLELLVDSVRALNGFEPDETWSTPNVCDSAPSIQNEWLHLSEGVLDLSLCPDVILSLLKHVSHTDRDMSALPHALRPLLLLTQHDYGFRLVRDALDGPAAQIGGQHLFASLVQRVNDCFSTENPDCQTTLAVCLQLLQSMLVGRSSLPLTFTAMVDDMEIAASTTDGNSVANSLVRFRQLHISGNRVRAFLGWSGVGDEGKPVRDLHALLEMLADDEPSLEYLRTGMKNLLSLLSEEFEVTECDLVVDRASEHGHHTASDSLPPLPEPRPLDRVFAERPYFVNLTESLSAPMEKRSLVDQRRVLVARRRRHLRDHLAIQLSHGVDLTVPKSLETLTCNLSEMAYTCCNGLSIRDELLKCGRKRDSGDDAIRHQKRRRGQASIIETGRSSKKFVAPMRGRGFVLRGGVGSAGSAGSTGASHGSGGTAGGSGGGRPDPFRSRPLNTSRPPSLHVDDFTKLVKDDNVIEELPRSRPYRDNRGFRGGRGSRMQSNRGGGGAGGGGLGGQSGSLSTGPSLLPTLPLGLGVQPMNPLNAAAALLPNWNTDTRPLSLLPFGLDSRSNQNRRDRPMR